MPRTTLVFDFFGVICSEVAPFWLARHFTPEQAVAVKDDLVRRADRGEVSQAEMFAALATMTGVSADRIEKEWLQLAVIDAAVLEFVRSCRGTYRLGLLTNSPSQFVRELLRRDDIDRLFDAVVVSSENGCAKPEFAIFDIMLRALDATPGDSVMIDDNPANVTAAQAVGMKAILFKDKSDLARLPDI